MHNMANQEWMNLLSGDTQRKMTQMDEWRAKRAAAEKASKFDVGNTITGALMSLLTMNPTPLLLAAGGEAARSATSSDMDLANMALNLGSKYLPTGPGAGPKTDINTGGLYKGTPTTPPLSQYGMGSVGLKNYVPNVQAPIANVTQPNFFEQLKGAMYMPQDTATTEKAKFVSDLMSKGGRVSSVTGKYGETVTMDKPDTLSTKDVFDMKYKLSEQDRKKQYDADRLAISRASASKDPNEKMAYDMVMKKYAERLMNTAGDPEDAMNAMRDAAVEVNWTAKQLKTGGRMVKVKNSQTNKEQMVPYKTFLDNQDILTQI